jgi:putative phosphoesterase
MMSDIKRIHSELPVRIGLISDTHGLLRGEVHRIFKGVTHILHAGDVGDPQILDELAAIAPVTAVRGNTDRGHWAADLPVHNALLLGGKSFYLLHIIETLDIEPTAFDVIVYGHTHKADHRLINQTVLVNPGSAGPLRGSAPATVAVLTLENGAISYATHALCQPAG